MKTFTVGDHKNNNDFNCNYIVIVITWCGGQLSSSHSIILIFLTYKDKYHEKMIALRTIII